MQKTLWVLAIGLIGISLLAAPAVLAITSGPFPDAIEEVPIERLLANIKANDRPAAYLEAFARIHLLAYIRQTKTLPATTRRPGDQRVSEGPFKDCTPIARPRPDVAPVQKCETEDTQYGFPAPRGLPEGSLLARHPPDDHLKTAREAYERVRAMDPLRIRPRLALAYIYDRFGEMKQAITELRFVLDQADKMPAKGQDLWANMHDRYWDYQIVAAEAIEHLSLISKTPEDRRLIARVSKKLEAPKKEMLYMTPIFVPLTAERSLTSFVNPSAHVRFDFTGQGLPLQGGWITKDAAWLVWDPRDKRRITSGFQLFGSVTWLTPWKNGYRALSVLDDNQDGKIAGTELKGLALWHDANGNGISDAGEVKPVADWHIVSLRYRHERQSRDAWISENGVTFANGETRPTYDWNVETRLVISDAR